MEIILFLLTPGLEGTHNYCLRNSQTHRPAAIDQFRVGGGRWKYTNIA